MTFHCKHYDINENNCRKLKADCIPGRRGCVLEGKVKISEDLEEKIKKAEKQKNR